MLFGYFPVGIKDAHNTPGTLVFTCLSHDIIAHETTHALLDGVHPRFNEPVNEDVLAFHEAFADIVALFQHFSYPGVLRDQIARTRGNLASENLLGQLAQQFGTAPAAAAALCATRWATSTREPENGRPSTPDVRVLEQHARAACARRDPGGRGVRRLPQGLSQRARSISTASPPKAPAFCARATSIPISPTGWPTRRRAARATLCRCASARIDYCPPVGITFGDYLRAIVTADYDFNPDDQSGFAWHSSRASGSGASIPQHAQHVARRPALADRRDGRRACRSAGPRLDNAEEPQPLFTNEAAHRA